MRLELTVSPSQVTGASAVILYRGNVNTGIGSVIGHVLALILEVVDLVVKVGATYAKVSALHSAILLQVAHHLVHDRGRNGKAIT